MPLLALPVWLLAELCRCSLCSCGAACSAVPLLALPVSLLAQLCLPRRGSHCPCGCLRSCVRPDVRRTDTCSAYRLLQLELLFREHRFPRRVLKRVCVDRVLWAWAGDVPVVLSWTGPGKSMGTGHSDMPGCGCTKCQVRARPAEAAPGASQDQTEAEAQVSREEEALWPLGCPLYVCPLGYPLGICPLGGRVGARVAGRGAPGAG
jgi:hypothetical protein